MESDTECKFEKLLKDIFNQEQIVIIQEWFGYCLDKYMTPDKYLVIIDPQDIIYPITNILAAMLGNDNVSSSHMYETLKTHKEWMYFENKLLNIERYSDKLDIQKIRWLTEYDYSGCYGASPGYTWRFKNTCKFMYANNYSPKFTKNSKGYEFDFFARLILIVLDRQKNIEPLPYGHIDNIINTELSGILNWSLEGLNRLKKFGFSYNENYKQKRELWNSYLLGRCKDNDRKN